jgi:hypothetical protein
LRAAAGFALIMVCGAPGAKRGGPGPLRPIRQGNGDDMSAADSSNILNRLELSPNLRGSLQRAAGYAHQQLHREVTLEHLLLALAEDRDAAVILEASNVDISGLVTEVSDYLGRLEDRVVGEEARQPTLGRDLIHICQSAAAAAQKSQRTA